MKFTQTIFFYGINDDNTITFFVLDEQGNKQFYRAKARYKLLAELDELKSELTVNDEPLQFDAVFGLAYQKGNGLILQLISFE